MANLEIDIDLTPLGTIGPRLRQALPRAMLRAKKPPPSPSSMPPTAPSPTKPTAKPPIRRKGEGKGILIDSGILKRSIRKHITPDGIKIVSAPLYASTHQNGRGPIPARPFIPLTPDGDIAPQKVKDQTLGEIQSALTTTLSKSLP